MKQCRVCDQDEMCDHQNGNCVKRDHSLNISSIWAYNCALCSGQCKSCDSGWYGENCTERCINCELDGCNITTGICFQCNSYYCGTNCTETCPKTCSRSRTKRSVCHRDTRQCLSGCQKGMWGDRCDIPCSKGCWNRECHFDGTCHCIPGYTGSQCIALRMDEELPAADPRSTTSTTSATENYNGLNTHQDGVSELPLIVLLGSTVILILITTALSFLLWRTCRGKYGRDQDLMLQLVDIKHDTFHSKETECFVRVKTDQ
ncbi:platelet endothelial aggregation receptor 1-like isoform X2 [Gigantopelta aegis]|uniref:platelet endothelial aggregation receptor 1-like isoform X2 n=1 Tax=Gigantopelta aegis TaxID=1735272 RepID=UPI001B8875D9|nr:platelet endothelial aggregation receptor 1-like isoform X2 [Gigantopelta aegis]